MKQPDLFEEQQDDARVYTFADMLEFPIVMSDGVGLDSTGMIIGWHRYGLPRPSAILHANTGSEKRWTEFYRDRSRPVLLSRLGYPQLSIVQNASPIAGDASLHDECLRKSVMPSLAYGGHSCSIKWKVDPQLKWVRDTFGWSQPRTPRGAKVRPAGKFSHGPWVTKLVGYDAGPKDARRIKNATEKWPPGHLNLYPLIEWGWDRRKCLDVVVEAGLPGWNPEFLAADLVTFSRFEWIETGGVPCKSACFMCPASQVAEITMMQKLDPERLDLALEIERRTIPKLREGSSVKGLGRNKVWDTIIRSAA